MSPEFSEALFSGFGISLSIIFAIGAQNAYVLRQGIRREHILAICFTCALSDTLLMITGIGGYQKFTTIFPSIDTWIRYFGALFLIGYGFKSFHNAFFRHRSLNPNHKNYHSELFADRLKNSSPPSTKSPSDTPSLFNSIATTLALTWLNPHVYLDTVVLIGSVSAKYSENIFAFAIGAISSSWIFFFGLGYGARVLKPIFTNSQAWKIFDILIGLLMWTIAWQILPL